MRQRIGSELRIGGDFISQRWKPARVLSCVGANLLNPDVSHALAQAQEKLRLIIADAQRL